MLWPLAIPGLPALAFLSLVALPRRWRDRILWVPLAAIAGSAALSLAALFFVWSQGAGEEVSRWSFSWLLATVAGRPIVIGMRLDPMAAILCVTVTLVATCVEIYSFGYMDHEPRRGWYFAVLSLFTAAMLTLLLAGDLLLLFAMWEVMGLCSYLLIGFWYEHEAPRKASQKAFLTTRVGDLGFLFALFVIYMAIGSWQLPAVLGSVEHWAPGVAAAAATGLLIAAMGKSAQVPLHVWLPDAMAGPTPASALIHAATMVAAGVYLVARTLPVFKAAPAVLEATLVIGAVTAVVGGLLACVQYDVKKVLAYSTISQLGLMFMALGAASELAAVFHLVTHAFFKSLLFLGAGVIIHAASTQDMREMGGLRRHMPVTWATFLIGSLALAGLIPLSGFFSKDEIVAALIEAHQMWAVLVLLFASGLTAFYMTRLYFRVFEGPEQTPDLHEGHRSMVGPMVALALVTVFAGWAGTTLAAFLGEVGEWPTFLIAGISTGVALFGIANGWWAYGRPNVVKNTAVYKRRLGVFYAMLERKLYFDILYDTLIIRPYMRLADLLAAFDRNVIDGVVNGVARGWIAVTGGAGLFDTNVVDGAVNGVARGWVAIAGGAQRFDLGVIDHAVDGIAKTARRAGQSVRKLQTGRLQSYQRLVLSAVVLLMVLLVLYAVVKGA